MLSPRVPSEATLGTEGTSGDTATDLGLGSRAMVHRKVNLGKHFLLLLGDSTMLGLRLWELWPSQGVANSLSLRVTMCGCRDSQGVTFGAGHLFQGDGCLVVEYGL